MRNFAHIKAKNWFEGRIQTVKKHKKISILAILIIISGFFFYNRLITIFPHCYARDYFVEGYLEHEKEWIAQIDYVEKMVESQKEENLKISSAGRELERLSERKDITGGKNSRLDDLGQLYELVGNAPIKEMIPSIMKQDQRVAAFVIGIAKKESDWGRHAPSQGGRTCYNYWGYKGSASRGTSMGYACFGSPEEAVEIVGKRIETLVSKNINDPKKFVVWKCGSSCAGHDPGAVQKWISDVSLYYGKVMQIKNS